MCSACGDLFHGSETVLRDVEPVAVAFAPVEARAVDPVRAYLTERAARWEFAADMLRALTRYGSLTPRQRAAVERCMARDAARVTVQAAPGVSMAAIEAAFARACEHERLGPLRCPGVHAPGIRSGSTL